MLCYVLTRSSSNTQNSECALYDAELDCDLKTRKTSLFQISLKMHVN